MNAVAKIALPVRFGTDANIVPLCAGIKTGVVWVGKANQNTSTSEKGALEKDALAAALRSDYVFALEAHLLDKVSPATAVGHQIIVLPELLTVTCTDATIDGGSGDGFQLRDLSRLNGAAYYFPPLSIPYVGRSEPFVQAHPVNFDIRSDYFAGLAGDLTKAPFWADFWAGEFASRIGQAKAVLHLVYGLQPLTPNAQNFLLEFPDKTMEATGRVVVRDILDMKLHSDWVATVLSDRPYTDVSPVSLATLAGHFKCDSAAVVQLLPVRSDRAEHRDTRRAQHDRRQRNARGQGRCGWPHTVLRGHAAQLLPVYRAAPRKLRRCGRLRRRPRPSTCGGMAARAVHERGLGSRARDRLRRARQHGARARQAHRVRGVQQLRLPRRHGAVPA
ncbi:hypothetical protein B0H12DRAFT_45681 [Mycena haematopus]|nr:hypothetical protein B0H12DRAFT_45681 [Mycena haematopus]